ncbi:MAG: RsmE family RNA methyltransferase [Nitrospiria bacterium]
MPHYFIHSNQISDNRIIPAPDLAHHLRDVLRIKVGESISLVDESPKCYETRVIASFPNPLELKVEREVPPPRLDRPDIHLGVSLLKRGKMEWVVQKATELGVFRLTPLITARTIVRVQDERARPLQARWLKIATEASQQSCRWDIPQIDSPRTILDFLKAQSGHGFKLIFSEKTPTEGSKAKIQSEIARAPKAGTVLIGPEGGWESAEIDLAVSAGFMPVSLGHQLLRAETAAMTALAILQYEASNGNRKCPSYE